MPRIPIAEIPNAPRAASAPVLTPGVNFSVNTGRLASAVAQPTESLPDFAPAGEEAGVIGAALQQAGSQSANVFSALAGDLIRSKDAADLARADQIMSDARSAHAMEIANLPEDEWVSTWESKFRPETEKKLSGLNLRQSVAERVNLDFSRFDGGVRRDLAYDAYKVKIDRDKQDLLNGFNRALDSGEYEKAEGFLKSMEGARHITPEQGAQMWMSAENTIRSRAAITAMNGNPVAFQAEMEEAKKTGKSADFPWMQAEDIAKYAGAADSQLRTLRTEQGNEIHNQILDGSISDETKLREAAGDIFTEKQIKQWVKVINSNVDYDPRVTSELRTEIANYDARADKDLSLFNKLQERIETTIAKEIQGPLSKDLFDSYSKNKEGKLPKPSERLRADIFQKIDTLATQGLLTGGKTGLRGKANEKKGEKASDIVDVDQNMVVFEAAQNLKDDTDQFFQDNPQATPEEASAWFKSKIGGPAGEAAAKAFASPPKPAASWAPYGGGGLGMPGQGPSGRLPAQQINERIMKKEPAAIRYNNPGAMYPGPSSKKFGSTETKIIGGGHKIAVFATPEAGAAAQFDLLDRKYTGKTLREAIKTWSGGNSVDDYLQSLKKGAGLSPDTVLTKELMRDPKVAIPLVRSMARHEAGKDYPLTEGGWLKAHKMAFGA